MSKHVAVTGQTVKAQVAATRQERQIGKRDMETIDKSNSRNLDELVIRLATVIKHIDEKRARITDNVVLQHDLNRLYIEAKITIKCIEDCL